MVTIEVRGKRHHGISAGGRIHNSIARRLGTAILTGQYQPGDILAGEMVASAELKISRPAYREAVKMLMAKGLIESRPKVGTIVCSRDQWNLLDPELLEWLLANEPSPGLLNELFELRMVIEPAAAALAASRRTDAHLSKIVSALAIMKENEFDSPAGQAADEMFHEAVLAATGNELLIRLASIISASVGYVAEFKRERHVARDPRPDHEALCDAIKARKPNEARKIMLSLISHAQDDTAQFD